LIVAVSYSTRGLENNLGVPRELPVPPFDDLWDPGAVPLPLLVEDEKDGARLVWWLPTSFSGTVTYGFCFDEI
jgi:hypothetical protein